MTTRDDFKEFISNERNTRLIKTGFDKLDNIYEGGLPSGLTILGANTGLGKTTFVLQLANNMAQEENVKVLFFSLEMSRYELLAKSLSHISYKDNELSSRTPNEFIRNKVDDIDNYFEKYEPIDNNLFIIDSEKNMLNISKAINDFCGEYENENVVVVIDYLQYIDTNINGNDRQNIEYVIKSLKTLSQKYHIPIIAISSLSREGSKRNDTTSFKESGSIEYTADYLIIMYKKEQTRALSFTTEDKAITLEFLKCRFVVESQFDLRYLGQYATFEEL